MDHQLEQLLDLRLKAHGLRLGLRLRRVAHLASLPSWVP
jgi:hypothetical protein